MNKIEHKGKTYEVLDATNPESIKLITHAKMGGGDIVESDYNEVASVIYIPFQGGDYRLSFGEKSIRFLGIQPLRLVPKEPVTFEATFALSGSSWYPLHHLSDGLAHQNSTTKRFRCVEIVEEGA
jgi:hypothetical protein